MHKFTKLLIGSVAASLFLGMNVHAASDLDTSPYVRWSDTHGSWTFGSGTTWYDEGTTVNTGVKSNKVSLKKGQHYYASGEKKNFGISKWVVEYKQHTCIHGNLIDNFYGEKFNVAEPDVVNGVYREKGHGCFDRNYSGGDRTQIGMI